MMQRLFPILLALLLALTGCAASPAGEAIPSQPVQEAAYQRRPDMTPREVVEDYFTLLCQSYERMESVDLSPLLSEAEPAAQSIQCWNDKLAQRRRLLWENQLGYVNSQVPAYITQWLSQEELTDERMEFWQGEGELSLGEEELFLHCTIQGEPGEVYPPLLAANTQHSLRLRRRAGQWEIAFHYFPGSLRKFAGAGQQPLQSDEVVLADLRREFAPAAIPQAVELPAGVRGYDGALAAEYARRYTETPNPSFYHVGDWMGNCSNFASQCIWYGFGGGKMPDISQGEGMTYRWFAGTGGGSLPWENVESFWNYATAPGGDLFCQELEGVTALQAGDLLQTRTRLPMAQDDPDEAERFQHSLVVLEGDTLLLGQNSPACFVYYSDLVEVATRCARPVWLVP